METRTEKERLEGWYRQYYGSIFRLCLMYLKDYQRAEDAAQEVFLKAWRKSSSYRGAAGGERQWLTAIAVNTCRDHLRLAWLRREKNSVTLKDILETEAGNGMPREEMDVVRAVAALPVKCREVILLKYYQGLTVREIGAALGLSVSAVNNRLAKAKSLLRPVLVEVYFDE